AGRPVGERVGGAVVDRVELLARCGGLLVAARPGVVARLHALRLDAARERAEELRRRLREERLALQLRRERGRVDRFARGDVLLLVVVAVREAEHAVDVAPDVAALGHRRRVLALLDRRRAAVLQDGGVALVAQLEALLRPLLAVRRESGVRLRRA